jgi:uncharacterized OsmC-like protein
LNQTWTTRVGSTREGTAIVRARAHSFAIGQPLDFGGEAAGASALEALLGALGADMLLRFRDLCDRRRLPIDQIEARVTGQLQNALFALGVVGEEGEPSLSEASVTLSVASPATPEALQSVWNEVLKRSPLVATLRSGANLNLKMQLL